jgi:triosephosphate isomerase (TIM)
MSFTFVANWKMHSPPLPAWVKAASAAQAESADCNVILCPPFTQLAAAQMVLVGTDISLGAQDCHAKPEGAFTGDIAAPMLARTGCQYVLVGHFGAALISWRNRYNGARQGLAALDAGLTPIVCIGESAEDRAAGRAEAVVTAQLHACFPSEPAEMLIAYEPVWAIGTGNTATPQDIAAMHSHLKKELAQRHAILYGGSVNASNIAQIAACEGVDGVLVGSASLSGDGFAALIHAVATDT